MTLYFRLLLLSPFALAIVGETAPEMGDFAIFQIAVGVMFAGGIPYLLYVVLALLWSFIWRPKDYTKAFVLTPLIFGVFCFVYGLLLAYTSKMEPSNPFALLGVAFTFSVFGFVVSAIYSWTALGLWWFIVAVRKAF